MQTLSPTESRALPQSQRAALVSLLVDDDPAIYHMVRRKVLSYGQTAREWLQPHTLSADPVMRRRAREIINHLARQTTEEAFVAFCLKNGEELDLETAALHLARTQYPDLNPAGYHALFDQWAAELRERIDYTADAQRILGTVHHYLFTELGFSGNEQYSYDPENCYLNRIVDRRTGNPIGLCAIYLFLARRLRLPVTGIGLPLHFICRYQSTTQEVYIDAFRKGKFWTKADCIKYLLQGNHGLQEGYLSPVTPRRMLVRMCANLHQTYAHLEMAEDAARVQRYLIALSK